MHLKFIYRHILFPWIIINDYPLWAAFNQLQLYSLSPMCLQFVNSLILYTIIALLLTDNYSTIWFFKLIDQASTLQHQYVI